jgi:hypothetical protein
MAKVQQGAVGYWSLVQPVWLQLNSSWDDRWEKFVREFRAIRPEVGHLYAAHWCQSEVCNGGFHQFFSNSTGLLAPEAMVGFRAIGLTEWAEILTTGMKFFGSQYPRERADREELLPSRQRGPRKEWDPFDGLDERFYELADRWEEAANTYAGKVSA